VKKEKPNSVKLLCDKKLAKKLGVSVLHEKKNQSSARECVFQSEIPNFSVLPIRNKKKNRIKSPPPTPFQFVYLDETRTMIDIK
jgi:hypothetical protein